jgi:hypothetical protein
MRADWLGGVLHAAGLQVVPVDGWQTRGGPLHSIDAVICHDTVTGSNWKDEDVAGLLVHGRPDLAGPLAQLGLDRQGRFWLIAAGRCNHNGFGRFGNQTLGIEAFNDAKEPWPRVQLDAYERGCAALCRRLGFDASHVLAHRESDPHRKVDPSNIDMDVFRQRVAAWIDNTLPEDDVTDEQDARLKRIEAMLLEVNHQTNAPKDGRLYRIADGVDRLVKKLGA